MKTKVRKIVGFDFFETKQNDNMTVKVIGIGNDTGVGLESVNVLPDVGLNNLSASQYRALMKGESFLEFWVEAIDHSKPTENNRLYTEKEFKLGMDRCLHKCLERGGVQGGEAEHPLVIPDPTLDAKANMAKIGPLLLRINPNNISHYIKDTKTENGKTYFLIRTNPSNPVIVKDIALGKVPTFSIRTLGDFPLVNGVNVGEHLIVVTIDYVLLPANATSAVLPSSAMKLINPAEATSMDVDFGLKVGNESVDAFGLAFGEESTLMVGMENGQIVMNVETTVETKSATEIENDVFNSIFD